MTLIARVAAESATEPGITHAVELVEDRYPLPPMGITADIANDVIIRMMELDTDRLLIEIKDKAGCWLRTTSEGQRQLGVRIGMKLDSTTKGRLRQAPPISRIPPSLKIVD